MNGKYVCNELVFNLLMMEYEVIGGRTGKKCMYIYSFCLLYTSDAADE